MTTPSAGDDTVKRIFQGKERILRKACKNLHMLVSGVVNCLHVRKQRTSKISHLKLNDVYFYGNHALSNLSVSIQRFVYIFPFVFR